MKERRSFPLLLVALLLLAVGGLIAPVAGAGSYLPRLLVASGLLALLWGAVRVWRSALGFLRRMREVAEPGPFLVWVLLGAVLLALSIGLSLEHARFDLTRRGVNSLSAASRQALAAGGSEVEMVAVYREGEPAAQQARDILRIYRTQGAGIRTRMLDPERDPAEARRLGIDFSNAVLVHADSIREVVSDLTEAALTTAVLRVRDPARTVLLMLEGHGESAPDRGGFGTFRRLLGEAGVEVQKLRLADVAEVPRAARAVLVAGPTSPLLPGEIAALRSFLDRGGRLGVLVDPDHPTGLEPLLEGRGVLVDGRRIHDEGPLTRSVGLGPETIAVQSLGDHEITHGLTSAIVLRGATRAGLAPQPVWGTSGSDLLKSAPGARLLDTGRPLPARVAALPASGVLPLGVALEWQPAPDSARTAPASLSVAPREKIRSRLVVIGDSDFLRDDAIGLYGNRAFAIRVGGWLAARDFLVNFPPVDQSGTPLRVGLTGFRVAFYLVELLLPLAMFGLGLWTWLRRR